MDDEKLEEKILRKVFLWMVAGGIGIGSVAGSGVLRIGKFTAADAEFMKQEMQFQCKLVEQEIRKDMPPEATRKRIRAIERHLENTTTFEVKEYDW